MPALRPTDRGLTDEEEARLQAQIAADPDDVEHDEEWFRRARPAIEVDPELVHAHRRGELRRATATPGQRLREELAIRGMSQAELARTMGRTTNAVNEIAQGKRAVTPGMALDLEWALGVSASLWLHLEADYRLTLERERRVAGS